MTAKDNEKLPDEFPAKAILAEFGAKTYGEVRALRGTLTEIPGIGEKTAERIEEALNEGTTDGGTEEKPDGATSTEPTPASTPTPPPPDETRDQSKPAPKLDPAGEPPPAVSTASLKDADADTQAWAKQGIIINPETGPTEKQQTLMDRMTPAK